MYTSIYRNIRIKDDMCRTVMSKIDVKQGCPLSPTLFSQYIDELETCLDENDGILCAYLT